MDEHKKYRSLERYPKNDALLALSNFKIITIREKIDGANSSVRNIDGELVCYSRNQRLSLDNTLQGFYQVAMEALEPFVDYLPKNCRVYGEWNVKHSVSYPEETLRKFYLFNVFDYETGRYEDPLKYEELITLVIQVDKIEFAPLLYAGEYQGIDHIKSFLNHSVLGAEMPEGVVVMDSDYVNRFGHNVAVKFVNDAFLESQGNKVKIPKELTPLQEATFEFTQLHLTEVRVEKQLNKFIDEGQLPTDLSIQDMGTVMKLLPTALYDDIIKEELPELVAKFPDLAVEVLTKELNSKVRKCTGAMARAVINKRG